MFSTKEENLKVYVRTDTKLSESDLPGYKCNISENGTVALRDIYNEDAAKDLINNLRDNIKDDNLAILLSKKYEISFDEEEFGYDVVQKLLSPNFNAVNFCLNRCSFFIDKGDTFYSVDFDYDLERQLNVDVSKIIENNEEALKFLEEAKSILQDIINGIEVPL